MISLSAGSAIFLFSLPPIRAIRVRDPSLRQYGSQSPLLERLRYVHSRQFVFTRSGLLVNWPCDFIRLSTPSYTIVFSGLLLTIRTPGIAVRLWQLGIEMRPLFVKESLWAYPLFAGIGGSFGYWIQGVEQRQLKILAQQKEAILEKRRRRDEVGLSKVEEAGTLAATS